MKICLLVHKIKPCGPVNAFKRIRDALDAEGFTVQLMSITDYFATDIYFDICISTGIRSDFINFLFGRSKFKYYYKVNSPFEDYPLAFGMLGYVYAVAHSFLFFLNAKKVFCCSRSISTSFFLKHRLLYLPQDFFSKVRSGVAQPSFEKKIILASPFSRRKRDFDLLKVIVDSGLTKKYKVAVVGDGPEKDRCVEEFGDSGVFFYPFCDSLQEFFRFGDVYCSASLSEGLPTIAMMASINGTRCLLSNIPAHQELVDLADNIVLFDSLSVVPGFIENLLVSECVASAQCKLEETMSYDVFVREFKRILIDDGN